MFTVRGKAIEGADVHRDLLTSPRSGCFIVIPGQISCISGQHLESAGAYGSRRVIVNPDVWGFSGPQLIFERRKNNDMEPITFLSTPDGGDSGGSPSRRTIVKGAAWSVPVIAAAASTPLAAASDPEEMKPEDFVVGLVTPRSVLSVESTGSQWGLLQFHSDTIAEHSAGDFYPIPEGGKLGFIHISGTKPGDIISGLTISMYISRHATDPYTTDFANLEFAHISGTSPSWGVPVWQPGDQVDGTVMPPEMSSTPHYEYVVGLNHTFVANGDSGWIVPRHVFGFAARMPMRSRMSSGPATRYRYSMTVTRGGDSVYLTQFVGRGTAILHRPYPVTPNLHPVDQYPQYYTGFNMFD